MKKATIGALICASLISACSDAKQASEVQASFVSTEKYRGHSCKSLRLEAERLKASLEGLSSSVDKEYKQDKTMEAVTWILFWPAVFAMDGNEDEAKRLADAKGEAAAIDAAMKAKGCRMST